MNAALDTWRKMTWRRIAVTQLIVLLAMFVESFEYHLLGYWMGHPSLQYVAMSLSALVLLPVTLYTDALVTGGARARVVYPLTIVMAFPLAFLVTGVTEEMYYRIIHVPQAAALAHRWVFVSTAENIALICGFGMVIYMNRRTTERMLERVQDAELKRVQLEGQLIESRLATAEAQVDPRMLFGALAKIRDGFNRASPDADIQLDLLVQHLRGALARTTALSGEEKVKP